MSPLARYLYSKGISAPEVFCADTGSDPSVLLEAARYAAERRDPLGRLLAKNPSLPVQGIVALIRMHPDQVWQNPAWSYLLAQPSFLGTLGRCQQASLIRSRFADHRVIRVLAGNRSCDRFVRCMAASSPHCPVDLLEDYPRHAWRVREALASNPRLPMHLQSVLAYDHNWIVRLRLSRRKDLLPSIIDVLMNEGECQDVLVALVNNHQATKAHHDRLIDIGSERVRNAVFYRRGRMMSGFTVADLDEEIPF